MSNLAKIVIEECPPVNNITSRLGSLSMHSVRPPPCFEEFSKLVRCLNNMEEYSRCIQKYEKFIKCFNKNY